MTLEKKQQHRRLTAHLAFVLLTAAAWLGISGGAAFGAGTAPTRDNHAARVIIGSPGLKVVAKWRWQKRLPASLRQVGRGVAWLMGGREIAAEGLMGLSVWNLRPQKSRERPTVYRLKGVWTRAATSIEPAGLIVQRNTLGVAWFVAGHQGRNPQLIMNWLSARRFRPLRSYKIRLLDVSDAGVQLIGPRHGDWFATEPYDAEPWARIHIWRSRDGRSLGAHLPALWQPYGSMFCTGGGRDIYWVSSGTRVYQARIGGAKRAHPVLKSVRLVATNLQEGALSPNGQQMLLLAGAEPGPPSNVAAILAPTSGVGAEWTLQYPYWALVPAVAPVFSANGKMAAFGVFCPSLVGHHFGTDMFIAGTSPFKIMYRAKMAEFVLTGMSFSPDGRRLALEGQRSVVVLGLPKRVPRKARRGLGLVSLVPVMIPPHPAPR